MAGAYAQQSLESPYRMTGEAVMAAFESQREVLQKSSVSIIDGRNEAIYGVVVSEDGCLLTKASEFRKLAKPELVIDRARYREFEVLGEDLQWDLIMIKVPAEGLVPVQFADEDPQIGTWVVVNGSTTRFARRALAGIVSAKSREIPVEGGAGIGVVLNQEAKVPTVEEVKEGSGAAAAGMLKGDVITAIDGKPVKSLTDIAKVLKDGKAGSTVPVEVNRDGRKVVLEVRLASKAEMFREEGMMSRNDMMSGEVSRRRSGFPRVIQHSVLGNSKSMGGPVIDLDGRCVGMNIARANRAETFAIPAKELKQVVAKMLAAKADKPAESDKPATADKPAEESNR